MVIQESSQGLIYISPIITTEIQLDTITASTRDIIHYLENLYVQYMGTYIVSMELIFLLCEMVYFATSEHIGSFKHTYIDHH